MAGRGLERKKLQSGKIRTIGLSLVIEALTARNLSTEGLLARFDLRPENLRDPLAEIELRIFMAVFEAAALMAHDRFLGLRLAGEIQLEQFGPPAIMILAASSLRAATIAWRRYGITWQSGTRFDVIERGDVVECQYQLLDANIRARRQDAEFSVALTCRMFRGVMGGQWAPIEVHFEHPAPEDADSALGRRLYHRAFHCPVLFGAPTNRIVMSKADFDSRHRSTYQFQALYAEPLLHQLERDHRHAEATIDSRVGRLVRERLGHETVDIHSVSGWLGMSPRSLQRALTEEGTSFREILRKCRVDLAETMLADPARDLIQVALNLGYADGAVLSRAFKNWTGVPPRRFRRSHD